MPMIELRTQLQAFLKTLHQRVYFQLAPDTAQFPYLVFDFPNSFSDGEGMEIITVDIDGWDKPADGSTLALETLMQTINENLNKKSIVTENIAVTFYLENRLPLQDDDKSIKRRKYIYQARLFERSE